MSLDEAAELPACSCAALVLCDLDAGSYPVRLVEDGGTLLLGEAGPRPPAADALAASRRRFFRALSSACETVVCERVLNTEDANEAYPSVMFEELLDCYRPTPTRTDDLDRATGLPQAARRPSPMLRRARTPSTTNLALGCDGAQPTRRQRMGSVPRERATVSPAAAPARRAAAHAARGRLPAAARRRARRCRPRRIESYLECPCKWFSLRRLRLSAPDAGFGPARDGQLLPRRADVASTSTSSRRGNAKVDAGQRWRRRARLYARDVRPPPGVRSPSSSARPTRLLPAHGLRACRGGTAWSAGSCPVPRPRGGCCLPGFSPVPSSSSTSARGSRSRTGASSCGAASTAST